jgi:hypothetical protein
LVEVLQLLLLWHLILGLAYRDNRGAPLLQFVDERGLANFDGETNNFAFFGLLPAVVLNHYLYKILNVEVFAHERRT